MDLFQLSTMAGLIGLFRDEAIEARRGDFLGSIDLTRTHLGWPITLIGGAFMLGLAIFAVIGEHTRSERASGQLVPSAGLNPILAPESGVATRVLVAEGEEVREGQVLVELSREKEGTNSNGDALGLTLEVALAQQKQYWLDELAALERSADLQRQSLLYQRDFAAQRGTLIEEQITLKRRQLESYREVYNRVRALDHGLLTALQVHQHEAAVLVAESELNSASLQRIDVQGEVAMLEERLNRAPMELDERRASIARALADIEQQTARVGVERTLVLRASRSGIVTGVAVAPGQSVLTGRRLLTLLPVDAKLQAELWVPSEAVGLLQHGTPVAMRYRAFPYRQFGHQYGRIVSIANNVLDPQDVAEISGGQHLDPAFRILVELDRQTVQFAESELKLRSGMRVDAELILERRRLYQLFFGSPNRAEDAS